MVYLPRGRNRRRSPHLHFSCPLCLVRLVSLVNFIAWVKGQTRPNDDEGPGKNKEERSKVSV